jgi:hypothetical protein
MRTPEQKKPNMNKLSKPDMKIPGFSDSTCNLTIRTSINRMARTIFYEIKPGICVRITINDNRTTGIYERMPGNSVRTPKKPVRTTSSHVR